MVEPVLCFISLRWSCVQYSFSPALAVSCQQGSGDSWCGAGESRLTFVYTGGDIPKLPTPFVGLILTVPPIQILNLTT